MRKSVKTIRDTGKLGTAQAFSIGFAVIYFIFITRWFSDLEIASIAVLGIITGLSNMISALGLVNTCYQKVPGLLKENKMEEARGLLQVTFWLPASLSVLLSLLAFTFASFLSAIFFKSDSYAHIIRIISVGIVMGKVYEQASLLLSILDAFGKLSLLRMGNDIFIRIAALIFYLYFGIAGYLWVLVLGQIIIVCMLIPFLSNYLFRKSIFPDFRGLIRYSFPFYLFGFVRFGSIQGDQFLISLFLKPQQLATYYVTRRFFDYLLTAISVLFEPLMPKFSSIKTQGLEALRVAFHRTSLYLAMALIPMSVCLALFSYPLLNIYGGSKYISGVPILIILSLVAVGYGLYSLFGVTVYITTKPNNSLWTESVSGITNFVLGYILLILSKDILGLAVARLISIFIAAFFARYLLTRELGFLPMAWDTWKKMTILCFVSAIPAALLQLFYYRLWLTPFYFLISAGLFLVMFSRSLKTEDIELFVHALPKKAASILVYVLSLVRKDMNTVTMLE